MSDHSANSRGIALMIAGSAFFALNDAFSKFALGMHMPPSQILALRGVMAGMILLGLLGARGELAGLRHALDRRVLVRAIAEAVSAALFITAISTMSIGDAAAVVQIAPIATVAAAVLFFGARLSWQRWMAVAAGFIGVGLIIKPGTSAFDPMAVLPLGTALLISFRDFVTGRIGSHVPTLVVTLMTAIMGMLLGFAGSAVEPWQPLTLPLVGVLTGGGIMLVLGHMLTIGAFRGTDPALIAPFRYAAVVCSVGLSAALFGNPPDLVSIGGMALIVAAGLFTMHSHRSSARRAITAATESQAA